MVCQEHELNHIAAVPGSSTIYLPATFPSISHAQVPCSRGLRFPQGCQGISSIGQVLWIQLQILPTFLQIIPGINWLLGLHFFFSPLPGHKRLRDCRLAQRGRRRLQRPRKRGQILSGNVQDSKDIPECPREAGRPTETRTLAGKPSTSAFSYTYQVICIRTYQVMDAPSLIKLSQAFQKYIYIFCKPDAAAACLQCSSLLWYTASRLHTHIA